MTPTYRWIFEPGTEREREVFPVNSHVLRGSGVEFTDNGEVRISRQINDILIVCSHDRAFFKILKAAYTGGQCDEYTIRVDKFCKNTWTEIYEGQFTIDNCVWDFERCRVTIKPKYIESNKCVLNGYDKEYNIYSLIPYVDRAFLIIPDAINPGETSGVQFLTTFTSGSSGGTPPGDGYTLIFAQELGVGSGEYVNLWGRQIFIVECGSTIPSDYIEVTACGVLGDVGLYTTSDSVTTYNVAQTLYNFTISASSQDNPVYVSDSFDIGGTTYNLYVLAEEAPFGFDQIIDNGIMLTDLIQALLDETCSGLTLKSELLLSADTEYITGGFNHWKNLMVFDITDIKFPDAVENATKHITTLQKILKELKEDFNMYWRVEGSELVIEHISWWKNQYSDAINLAYIRGNNVITIIKDNSAKRHEFSWAEQRHVEFVGVPIAYDTSCTGDNVEKIKSSFITDWYLVRNYPDDVTNNGLFIAACQFVADLDGEMVYQMKSGVAPLTNVPTLNAHLTWSYIHSVFHLHERSASSVYINGSLVSASSVKKSRQIELRFQNKCFDIDTTKQIITQAGQGEISDWSFTMSNNVLSLKVLI